MDAHDLASKVDSAPVTIPASDESGTIHRTGPRTAAMPPTGRLLAFALGAGILAGLGSWLIGETVRTAFRPPYQPQHVMGQVIMKATFKDQSAADLKNATLAFSILGGTLGLALGLAGGIACRSGRAGTRAAVVGLVLGSLMAAGASMGLLPLYFRALDKDQEGLSLDLTLPLLVHCGIWSAAGLAGGLAYGIGLGGGRDRLIKAGIGGLLGAALGGALYEVCGAMAFPDVKTTNPLSLNWETRLLARLLVAILTGMMAALVVNMPGRHPGFLTVDHDTVRMPVPGSDRSTWGRSRRSRNAPRSMD